MTARTLSREQADRAIDDAIGELTILTVAAKGYAELALNLAEPADRRTFTAAQWYALASAFFDFTLRVDEATEKVHAL